jgi:ankyrin repeat protein
MEPTPSDDETQVMAATSIVTTKPPPIFYLVEATKSDEEAKAPAATRRIWISLKDRNRMAKRSPLLQLNRQANLDLLEAANSDDEAQAVAALTQSGVDVNCRENFGFKFPPLIRAIFSKNLKVAQVLLADPRVDVNATDTKGITALHRGRDASQSAIILSQRTDIDWNPSHKAGGTPLLFHSRLTNVATISELIKVKSVQLLARSIDGFTALHELAERESPFPDWFRNKPTPETSCKLIDILLAELELRGHNLVAFVNATDVLNRTALQYIAEEGSVQMLNRLLERCPTGMTVTGVTPIHLAVRRAHTAVVGLLLHVPSMDANIGATVNASPPSGLKPWESIHLDLCRPNLLLKAPKELPLQATSHLYISLPWMGTRK